MAIAPAHYIWQRERSLYHSGATRSHSHDEVPLPRGPNATPVNCLLCGKKARYVRLGLSSSSSNGTLEIMEQCIPRGLNDFLSSDQMLLDPPPHRFSQGMI